MHEYPPSKGPVVLCILDGWGHRTETAYNAVALANTPVFDTLLANSPNSYLSASGYDVGLPDGQVGNSEVGHMNIGAGRIVIQELPRINTAAEDGSLSTHSKLNELAKAVKKKSRTFHIMGLLSPGGVHSHQEHFLSIINGILKHDVPVTIHAFTDGRDTLPKAAKFDLPLFLSKIPKEVKVASVIGRYFSMDRDNRWERIQKAYDAIALGIGQNKATNAVEAINSAYDRDESDEFITPTIISDYDGMKDGDAIIMVNFRADRVRQLLSCFCNPNNTYCTVKPIIFSGIIGMTNYSSELSNYMTTLYPKVKIINTLGEVVARSGKKQVRLAETEKYPHVTFFFNGGEESRNDGEDREMVPSPKVSTYDRQPEMSAEGVLRAAVKSLKKTHHDLLVINFANADMVGHTGDLKATISAVEKVDQCIGTLISVLVKVNGQMLITADHGNCELMWDEAAESPHTAHTSNPVPLILVNGHKGTKLSNGILADLAPSILTMLGLKKPKEMTGKSLLS